MTRVSQAGLRGATVVGRYPSFSKVMQVEGIVIAVRYVDDALNISKTFVEYDVRDLRTGQIYTNVRRGDSMQGMDDGNDHVLRPSQRLIGATRPDFDPKVDAIAQSDGDRVVLTFSYGSQNNGVITQVVPHARMTYGAKRKDGQRCLQTHKGTTVETKADGTYQITRGRTVITLREDETIEIIHKSGSRLRFLDNGDVDVVPARDLLLGSDAAALPMARQTDQVVVTIPIGTVQVTNPVGVPPTIPNPAPIPLSGTIQSGSANVKG